MIIIIEGCDKSGKTTLAKTLAARVGYDYYHAGISSEKDLFHKYTKIIQSIQRPTIVDRFYPSELVYGPLIRGFSRLKFSQFQELNKLIKLRMGLYIHCFADIPTITARFKEQDEKLLSISLIPEVLKQYQIVATHISNELSVFNFDSGLIQSKVAENTEKLVLKLQEQKSIIFGNHNKR